MTPLIDDLIMTNDDRHHGKDDDYDASTGQATVPSAAHRHLLPILHKHQKIYPRSLVDFRETVE